MEECRPRMTKTAKPFLLELLMDALGNDEKLCPNTGGLTVLKQLRAVQIRFIVANQAGAPLLWYLV